MKKGNSALRLPGPEKGLFWITVLLLIKFGLLYFLISENRPTLLPETIAVCSGDCESYLSPVDNLLANGSYEPDYRMPGLAFPYWVLRLLTEKNTAVNLLIVFQTSLDALATLLLALSLLMLTGKRITFFLTLFFYGIGVTVSCYNNWVLSESLTCSMLITGFYFLLKFSKDRRGLDIFLSGLFFTWSYFLRPVNAPVFALSAVILFLFLVKKGRFRAVQLFLLPAILFNGAWVIRNYVKKHKLYLLTENVFFRDWYGDDGLAAIEFCKTFSDFKITYSYFETEGLTYFGQAVKRYSLEDIRIPPAIYTPDFNEDSLLAVRALFDQKRETAITATARDSIGALIKEKMERYTASVKQHHPFIAYFKTPVLLTKNFISQAGVHNLYFMPYSMQPLQRKVVKMFFILIYASTFLLFIGGLVFYKHIFENKLILLSYLIAFYIIFIHSIILRSIEPRYLVPAYPFFVTGAIYTIHLIRELYNKRLND